MARVLYINNIYNGGGAEKVTRQLYYGIRQLGLETFMLVGYDEEDSPLVHGDANFYALYGLGFSKRMAVLNGCLHNNAPFINKKFRKKVMDIIRRNQIDILHINNAHGCYIGIEDIAYLSKYVKVVWTLHDMWAVTGHCAYAFECIQWQEECCAHCGRKRTYPAFYYNNLQRIYRKKRDSFTGNGITFVTPSKWLENICRKSYLKNENIITINNGVDTSEFICNDREYLRKNNGIPDDKNVILFCAASLDNEYKGFSYLVDALDMINDKSRYCLMIIGHGLPENIISGEYDIIEYGYIDSPQRMSEIYSMADVFVLPSVAENFPCVALEALASGTPVIGFDTGGIPEIVDGNTGWIVERRNSKKLAQQIQDAFADKNKLAGMRSACRARAKGQYSLNGMLERYRELYQEVLAKDNQTSV